MRAARQPIHAPGPDFAARPNSGNAGSTARGPRRLNLLLSYAGWDEDPWVERLPRLLDPMGIQSITAQTGTEAGRVIQATPIHVAVVDLGLPLDRPPHAGDPPPRDPASKPPATPPGGTAGPSSQPHTAEAGAKLLRLLARLRQPPPTVVIKRRRTSRDDQREIAAALAAGAFAVLDRPRDSHDLELVLEVLRRVLRRHYQDRWPEADP